MRRLLPLLLLALFATAPLSAATPALRQNVVLVSIDGLSSELYLRADELGLKIPHLRRLIREGSHAQGVESVMPSLTFPAHVTLITGVGPLRHGVIANGLFDPGYLRGAGPYTFYEDIKSRTLFDAVAERGGASGAVWWPVTMAAPPIAHNLPDLGIEDVLHARLVLHLSSPDVRALIPSPETIVGMGGSDELDGLRARLGIEFIRRQLPLVAIHFIELDTAAHAHGPRSAEALAALEKTDGLLGEILEAVRAAGTEDRTTVAVVSDHGFLPVHTEVRAGAVFATLGLLETGADGKLTKWLAYPWGVGGSLAVYLHPDAPEGTAARLDAVLALLESRPEYGVHRLYRGEELERLGGFPGAYAVLDAAEGFFFSNNLASPGVLPARLRGVHGQVPTRPGLSAGLVIRGPGIQAGKNIGNIRLVDVAPTLARILGVELGSVEGRVLEEIFIK